MSDYDAPPCTQSWWACWSIAEAVSVQCCKQQTSDFLIPLSCSVWTCTVYIYTYGLYSIASFTCTLWTSKQYLLFLCLIYWVFYFVRCIGWLHGTVSVVPLMFGYTVLDGCLWTWIVLACCLVWNIPLFYLLCIHVAQFMLKWMVMVKQENGALVMNCVGDGTARPRVCCLQCTYNFTVSAFL